VTAIRNEILVTDFGRFVRAKLLETFEHGLLSLDEAGRIYALVRHSGDRSSLWILTAAGERVAAFDFPSDVQLKPIPPVVGYDHRTYFSTADSVICLSPEGALLWRRPAGAAVAGIAVAPNDDLLVAAGSHLFTFNSQGDRKPIHSFEGDMVRTAPAMTQDGDLLLASTRRLYRLTRTRLR
jgi:hypothetical protein